MSARVVSAGVSLCYELVFGLFLFVVFFLVDGWLF